MKHGWSIKELHFPKSFCKSVGCRVQNSYSPVWRKAHGHACGNVQIRGTDNHILIQDSAGLVDDREHYELDDVQVSYFESLKTCPTNESEGTIARLRQRQ